MRIRLELARPARVRYRDSVHAALTAGLRAAGAPDELITGLRAAPWTFGFSGRSFSGGGTAIRSLTISTSSPRLGDVLTQLDPAAVRWISSNGDVVDLTGAAKRMESLPIIPGQEEITVGFVSPFLVSGMGTAKKSYARSLVGLDLSSAFSAGLSRRLEREIHIDALPDRLSARTEGASPMLVRVRKTGARDLILPALSVVMTLRGRTADLRDAYFAGLGEKTRYGFGCAVAL